MYIYFLFFLLKIDALGMTSTYEFIYSFRDKKDDPFPDLLSDNAINALEMIKRLKETISTGKFYYK